MALIASPSFAQNKKGAKKAAPKKTAVAAKQAKTTSTTDGMTAKAKALYNYMLPNTQKVFVIDSTIVDRDNVLSAIPLPKAYGQYVKYSHFFGKPAANDQYVFVNGFGNRCYYTEIGTDSISRLYMCDKLGDSWAKPRAIKEVNDNFTDICFPYMASDGQTLYFAAKSKDDEGLGHRDIFMTKYDADEGTFMQAENIGLPFNSSADDYAFIIADADRMAWFASTRRQPEGKACVYAFVPAASRENYNADEMEHKQLVALADLTRISDTWTKPEKRAKEMQRLNRLHANADHTSTAATELAFVVNDATTYTRPEQFHSDETRRTYFEVIRLTNSLKTDMAKLEKMRLKYHNAPSSERTFVGKQIEKLEQIVNQTRDTLRQTERELRIKENNILGNK